MLAKCFPFIVIVALVGCTNTPTSSAEGTNLPIVTEPTVIKNSTAASPEPTKAPSPTAEPKIGELLWTFKPGTTNEPPFWVSPVSSATASNGIVYVGASNGSGGQLAARSLSAA